MKALVIVDNINSVPAKNRDKLYVVTSLNWQEAILYFSGKTADQYLYIHENAPFDRLLKMVEEYKGNLAVYVPRGSAFTNSLVMLSRFTSIVNRCPINLKTKDELLETSPLETKLRSIKEALV